MTDNTYTTTLPVTDDDFEQIRVSPLYIENENRKKSVRVHVIQTIIAILERDIPTIITNENTLAHCNFRVQAMKDQNVKFYDPSFYRSVHSFLINFIDAFQTGRIGESDVSSEIIERRFLYGELLAELEDFVHDF